MIDWKRWSKELGRDWNFSFQDTPSAGKLGIASLEIYVTREVTNRLGIEDKSRRAEEPH